MEDIEYAMSQLKVVISPSIVLNKNGGCDCYLYIVSPDMDNPNKIFIREMTMVVEKPNPVSVEDKGDMENSLSNMGSEVLEWWDSIPVDHLLKIKGHIKKSSLKVYSAHICLDQAVDTLSQKLKEIDNPNNALILTEDDHWELTAYCFFVQLVSESGQYF
jgi:hypothetical protein